MTDPEDLMRMAIDKTRQGIAAGQTPFGCAVASGDEVVAVAHNVVWSTTDITAHAEITALRQACTHTGAIHIEGGIVATSRNGFTKVDAEQVSGLLAEECRQLFTEWHSMAGHKAY